MFIKNSGSSPNAISGKVTILLAVFIGLLLVTSIVFYLTGEHWERRVLFFPEVNTDRYVAEVRYLPPMGSQAANIKVLLQDIILGPSNFSNALLLPEEAELNSVMVEDGIVYVGLSTGVYQASVTSGRPREKLQAIANAVFFNFPGIRKVYFFVGGTELTDLSLSHQADRTLEYAHALVSHLGSLKDTMSFLATNPLVPVYPAKKDIFMFENGARWDERLF